MRRFFKFLFTVMLFLLSVAAIAFVMMVAKTYTGMEKIRETTILEASSEVKEKLSYALQNTSEEDADRAMEFIKQKAESGELQGDIKGTLAEGSDKFNLNLSQEDAAEIAEAIESLENMGFSTQKLVEETDKVYTKYGEEFVDHMEEAFVEAAKDAAGNAAQKVWDSAGQTLKKYF